MTAWANILFLLFVVFIGMFMTHLALRHERLREKFRGGGGAAVSRSGGTANSSLDSASLESFINEGFRNSGGIGGVGGYAGGGLGNGDISSGMGGGVAHGGGSLNGGHIYSNVDSVMNCSINSNMSIDRRHINSGMDVGNIEYIGGKIKAQAHKGHYNFEHGEDQGRRGWHEPIDQPHHYPGGGATITPNWKGTGSGSGWVGYGWPFVWWGPAWYPEYAYVCNKDSDCALGKCGTSGFCVV